MRDIVLFIDVPDAGSTAMYHRAARSLGLRPLAVRGYPSGRSNIPASDDCLQVVGMDVTSILSAIDRIGRERIAGVFAAGSSQAELAARLAAALRRPHADPEVIALCNNKHRLRAFLEGRGLNTVPYHHVETMSEASRAVESLGDMVVVKPVSSTGSNGVRICRTSGDALSHAKRLLKRNRGGALIERYIDAPQYSVECFDGIPLNVKRLHFSEGPFPIIVGIDSPAQLKSVRFNEIKNYSSCILRQIGLNNGPAVLEIRSCGLNNYVIEINPRPSISGPLQIYIVTGIDLSALCLKFYCRIPYDQNNIINQHLKQAYTGRYVVRNGSSVRAIAGVEEARKVPHVNSIYVNDSHFYRLGPGTCAHDRVVAVHTQADSIEVAAASADLAIKKLAIIYDKFPMNIIKFYTRKIRIVRRKFSHKYWIKYGRREPNSSAP